MTFQVPDGFTLVEEKIAARSPRAKRIATQAINKAAKAAAAPGARSTQTRAAYKIKADALDRVARILAGKED